VARRLVLGPCGVLGPNRPGPGRARSWRPSSRHAIAVADFVPLSAGARSLGCGMHGLRWSATTSADVGPLVDDEGPPEGVSGAAGPFQGGGHHVDTTLEKRKAALRRPFHNALEFIGFIGAGEGIRTLDPNLGKVVFIAA
jgi:hypothetical protein